MKKIHAQKCDCQECKAFSKLVTTEAELHSFVGNAPSNVQCGLAQFQDGLLYTNALHWDVGYGGDARYFVYRDDEGRLLAWYDRAKKIGFKPNAEDLQLETYSQTTA